MHGHLIVKFIINTMKKERDKLYLTAVTRIGI